MMKNSSRFTILSFLMSAAYLLSACGGILPQSRPSEQASTVQANVVAFTGIVQAISGIQWTVSGQQMTVDAQASVDPAIKVGDRVRVEANVSPDGAVIALKVETSAGDDIISTPSSDASNTSDPLGTSTPDASAAPAVSNTSNPSVTQVAGNNENEVFGMVEAVGVDAITVNGVTYILAGFTEMKDPIAVGDQVKLHVIVNADSTLTVREVEKADHPGDDNGISNVSNDNSNDDGPDNNSNADNSDDDSDDDSNENETGGGNNRDSGGG
jgi:hypothetical protein